MMIDSKHPQRPIRHWIWLSAGVVCAIIAAALVSFCYRGYRQQQIVKQLFDGGYATFKSTPILGNGWTTRVGSDWEHAFSHLRSIDTGYGWREKKQMELIAEACRISFGGSPNHADCELHFSFVQDEELAVLEGLKNVRVLTIHRGNLTSAGMVHLLGLPNLEVFSLNGNYEEVLNGVAQLSQLKRLRSLDLAWCGLDDNSLMFLRDFTELHSLNIGHCGVTDNGLKQFPGLPNVRELNIEEMDITDEGLNYLGKFPKLTQITLSRKLITDAGIVQIKREFPDITISRSIWDKP